MSQTIPPLFYRDQSDRGRLLLTGRDRQSFLQGMVTNDVAKLTPGQGCYAFLLDATGHVLADARILCRENALLLDVEPGMAPLVAETLEKYLIMERVKITDGTGETRQFMVGGTDAAHLFETLAVPGIADWREGQSGPIAIGQSETFPATVAAGPPMAVPVYQVYIAPEDSGALMNYLTRSGAVELPAEIGEAIRVESGIPRFGIDMDARVLAPETGQRARAISYKKGCYIGQEIVARIDARGHLNRGLCGFTLSASAPLPAPETPVTVDGKDIGRITSAAISPTLGVPVALGYIRREHSEWGTKVLVEGAEAAVAALPFVSAL